MGATEGAALDAGTVGLEGGSLTGHPNFDALRARGSNHLTPAEQTFVDRDVRVLSAMLDDFAIDEARPPEVWAYVRQHKFFGMFIPERYGGLGFGHYAHAAVITCSAALNVPVVETVMVPNSLGRMVRGFVVNFDKRYITLVPVATVVGLAFQAIDRFRRHAGSSSGMTRFGLKIPALGFYRVFPGIVQSEMCR